MSKLDNKPRGRVGRPPIEGDQLRARAPSSLVRAVEEWAYANRVTRTEAIRRLIELGLKATSEKIGEPR